VVEGKSGEVLERGVDEIIVIPYAANGWVGIAAR
jgi:hypothetical protein